MDKDTGDAAGKAAHAEGTVITEVKTWNNVAADCWSVCGSAAKTEGAGKTAAADPDHWMEGRIEHRREEEASKLGLDPNKASWDDVIKTRAEKGTAANEGRVERLRQDEAKALGLPTDASWEKVNTARVQARIHELENKYGKH